MVNLKSKYKSEKLFTFIQCTINIFEQSCIEVLKKASEQGINVIAKEIFANGRLTNFNNNHHQENFIKITKVASNLNITIEDLALIWVYQLPFVKIVLTGASTINQLDKNINSIRTKIKLTKTKINRLSDTAGNMDQYITLQQRLIALQSELTGLVKSKKKLLIKSPIKGKVKDLASLSNDIWVSNSRVLQLTYQP